VLSCDEKRKVARYFVEDRGRIVHVGDDLPEAFARAERVELGRGTLCPAFADTHVHFMPYALFRGGLDLRSTSGIESSIETIREYAASRKDRILVGFGASPHSVIRVTKLVEVGPCQARAKAGRYDGLGKPSVGKSFFQILSSSRSSLVRLKNARRVDILLRVLLISSRGMPASSPCVLWSATGALIE
jgi:hypothetical protein